MDVTGLGLNNVHGLVFKFHLVLNTLLLLCFGTIEEFEDLGGSLYLHYAPDMTVIEKFLFDSRKHGFQNDVDVLFVMGDLRDFCGLADERERGIVGI